MLARLNSFYDADANLVVLPDGGFGVVFHQSNDNTLHYAVYR